MPKRRRLAVIVLFLVILTGGAVVLLLMKERPPAVISADKATDSAPLPEPGSALYEKYAQIFLLAVAALDEEQDRLAGDKLSEAIELVPGEPAARANRGLLRLRHNKFSEAAADLDRAKKLAPDSAEIEMLLGRLAEKQSDFPKAARHFRKALEHEPKNVMILYALANSLSVQGPENDPEYQRHLGTILEAQPYNLAVLTDYIGVAARLGDRAAFGQALERLRRISSPWSGETLALLKRAESLASGPLPAEAPVHLIQLQNVLRGQPGFGRSRRGVAPHEALLGESVEHFLRLAPLRPSPSPADMELAFAVEPLTKVPAAGGTRWNTILPVWLTRSPEPSILVANGREARFLDGTGPHLDLAADTKRVDSVVALHFGLTVS